MKIENNIEDDRLRSLLHAIPGEKVPLRMNERIMERIFRQKNHAEVRSERRILTWAILLSAMVAVLGGWVLFLYLGHVATLLPDARTVFGTYPIEKLKDYLSYISVFLPLGGIVLVLLVGDALLRRRFMARHHKKSVL